jgi:hypothetical protein
MMSETHVVMFSGGICSWAAAKRVVKQHGTDGVVLLFTDTLSEDEDLYRFLDEAAANVGAPLIRIADGRSLWECFRDHHAIANNRMAFCSRELKREMAAKWLNEHCDPEDTTLYVGFDFEELHRWEKLQSLAGSWKYLAPMTDRPYLSRAEMIDWLRSEGIEPPRLYGLGFAHNNCGGFCVRAGQGAFIHLLKTLPCRYAEHERKEQEFRQWLGKDVAILKHRSGPNIGKPLTLRELREKWQAGQRDIFDAFDFGGCGCMVDDILEEWETDEAE